MDTGCSLEHLLEAMDNWDEWWERVLAVWHDDDDDDDIYNTYYIWNTYDIMKYNMI